MTLSSSPVPLYGEYGCIRFKDLRKLSPDWSYMPIESREELSTYTSYMKERPGEYDNIRFLPAPKGIR